MPSKLACPKTVYKRMKSLQTGTPAYLQLIKVIDAKAGKETKEIEQSLHKQF